jgi:hypothetical protein
MNIRNKLFNKDDDVNMSAMAGHLHQIANDAIQKEFNKIMTWTGYDPSYWNWKLKLEFSSLSTGEFAVLDTVTIDEVKHV